MNLVRRELRELFGLRGRQVAATRRGCTVTTMRIRAFMRMRALLVLITAVLTVSTAFGSARAAAPAFTSWTETFVDRSRPSAAVADSPGAPDRTVVTTIYRPKGKGPFPLVVFANAGASPNVHAEMTQLFGAWAAAGYVVAAAAFPPANFAENELVDQAADMSFVLTQVLRESRDPKRRLHGAIDRRHVGAVGLSSGGATTYLVVFDDCCRDLHRGDGARRFASRGEHGPPRRGRTAVDRALRH